MWNQCHVGWGGHFQQTDDLYFCNYSFVPLKSRRRQYAAPLLCSASPRHAIYQRPFKFPKFLLLSNYFYQRWALMVTEILHSWLFCTSISWEIGTDFCVTPEGRQDNEKSQQENENGKSYTTKYHEIAHLLYYICY